MSEVITFNTSDLAQPVKVDKVKTFELLPEGHPILKEALPDFDFSKPPVNPNEFASILTDTCRKFDAFGLSANQCGFKHRVFVMGLGDEYVAFYNPKITKTYENDEVHMNEGCLSFPMLFINITRPNTIEVEYQDFTGTTKQAKFTGLSARIFQHELDHMDGVVYTDRAKPVALNFAKTKRSKLLARYKKAQVKMAKMAKAKLKQGK